MIDVILAFLIYFISGFFMMAQIASNCEKDGFYKMSLFGLRDMGRIECMEMKKQP